MKLNPPRPSRLPHALARAVGGRLLYAPEQVEEIMSFEPVVLGRTGMKAGRLGLAASYGVPTIAVEEAVERGVNYLYWGSIRRDGMGQAIRNMAPRMREKLIIVVQVYTRFLPWSLRFRTENALSSLKIDYADVLLYGWWPHRPPQRLIDAGLRLKEEGKVRHLALSTHTRPLVPDLARTSPFDIFHVRYNAAHRGAEEEVFPHLSAEVNPGIVAFTATRWGNLLKDKNMPPGEGTPRSAHCYRFALSHPAVHLVLCGPKNREQMKEALLALDEGPLSDEEMAWMRRVGDHVHGEK